MSTAFDWLSKTPPCWAEWLGIITTAAGTVLALLSTAVAVYSAYRAKKASEAARDAAEMCLRLGRVTTLADLLLDMQALQSLIHTDGESLAIAAKCDRVRGRVVRFKAESPGAFTIAEQEALDKVRMHLESMSQVVTGSTTMKAENRSKRLQVGFGKANDALNEIVGSHVNRVKEVT